jgi:hypothetical protein
MRHLLSKGVTGVQGILAVRSRRRAVFLAALFATVPWAGILLLFAWMTGNPGSGGCVAGFSAAIFAAQFMVLSMIAAAPASLDRGDRRTSGGIPDLSEEAGTEKGDTQSAAKRTSQGTRDQGRSYHLGINPGGAAIPAMRHLVLENSS